MDRSRDEKIYRQILDLKASKGDRKRIELLDGLIEAIACDGWENVSFETLGRRLGMRKGHVTYYFASRETMLELAIRYAVAVGQALTVERIQSGKTWSGRLRGWVEGPFVWIEKHPAHSAVMRLLYYLCSYSAPYRALHTEIRRMGNDRAADLLAEHFSKRPRAELRELAWAMQAVLTGALLEQITIDGAPPMAKLRERTVKTIFRLVGVEESHP